MFGANAQKVGSITSESKKTSLPYHLPGISVDDRSQFNGKRDGYRLFLWTRSVFFPSVYFGMESDTLPVVQELGREAMIPFASIFASSKPFKAPFAALFQQCLFSALSVIVPPPGDAYVFVINCTPCISIRSQQLS
jgi:hypothetical protein